MPIPAGPIDAGEVVGDVACRKCSYNLNGLPKAGRCPECGTPVGVSVRGDALCFSDPDWLETLAKGLRIILWGILFALVAGVTGHGLAAALGPPGAVLAAVFQIGVAGLSFWGAYLVTSPDPSGLGEKDKFNIRSFVRTMLLVGFVGAMLGIPAGLLAGAGILGTVFAIGSGLASLASAAGEFARYILLEKLALRIPAVDLAKTCRTVRWGYTICVVLAVFLGLIAAIAAAAVGPAAALVGCIIIVPMIGLLVFAVMAIGLQYKLAKAFQEQAALARAIWADVGGTLPAR